MAGKKAEEYYNKNAKPIIKAVKNNELNNTELKKLLDYESENKDRVTVKKAIRSVIGEEEEFNAELEKIRPEPIVKVKHETFGKKKIISGVSQGLSDLTGIPLNVIRLMFIISFVLIIGIPIYFILSLFIRD